MVADKHVQIFAPEEMQDLEFEPAAPLLAGKMQTEECMDAARGLAQLGSLAERVLKASAKSSNVAERRAAASALAEMSCPGLAAVITTLLTDPDARTRRKACEAAGRNWDPALALPLVELFRDSDGAVRSGTSFALGQHRENLPEQAFIEMLEEDGVATAEAIKFVDMRRLPRAKLVRFLSSKHLCLVSTAFVTLRDTLTLDEVAPLLANPLPWRA